MKKRGFIVLAFMMAIYSIAPQLVRAEEPIIQPKKLTITGLQVSGTREFVEVYNPNYTSISVEGWKLTYTNATGGNLRVIATLSGFVAANSHVLYVSADFATAESLSSLGISFTPLLYTGMVDSGGFVRLYEKVLVDTDYPDGFKLIETLGWKNTSTASADLGAVSLIGLKSVKRCTDLEGNYVARSNNQTDFYINALPDLLRVGLLCSDIVPLEVVTQPIVLIPPDIEPDPIELPIIVTPLPVSCEGILINEVLPNALGADTGNEFIELINPTPQTIDLNGCKIEVGTKSFSFAQQEVFLPHEVRAYSDAFTSITLPNSSGGTVRLVSLAGVEISTVVYPEDMDDDQSWALFEGGFQATYVPTFGLQNVSALLKPCPAGEERNPETNYCQTIKTEKTEVLTQCSETEFLNPETNRCNKIKQSSTTGCVAGQERNPETNRCRNIIGTTLARALTPCLDSQERNPATNRCRSIDATELTACREGQERNSETNRCRTVVLADTDSQIVQDVESPTSVPKDWLLGAIVGIVALSYAVYEWRLELRGIFKKVFRHRHVV